MNAIITEGLTKRYKDKTAVDSLNLSIDEGELFALLGVNGAGKTTTIRMLTCLSTPSAGHAKVFGHDVMAEPDEVKRLVGISTQDTAVAENLTVYENLKFMAGVYMSEEKGKEAEKSISDRIENIIKMFNLDEVRNKKAKTLSGGWKRKLSIAMALIGEPKILFLDEPTLGLDVLARRELWKIIEDLKSKVTIILTTHYMEEAEALADRIAVMISGKIVEIGTMDELEERTGKKGLEEVFVEIAGRN
ncbi:MAG: ATP-binding cassette domain-containing protein [Lachnospiraceae bacterium]|nr:ATP-binding cassette domain-containing protein [Lachnospiraceae bacterium]MCR5768882.1 ATP-binding cassette domain-containing protein [Lachnospiraceae bacterium]